MAEASEETEQVKLKFARGLLLSLDQSLVAPDASKSRKI